MFIPYEKISKIPLFKNYQNLFYSLKIKQNLKYIDKNFKNLIKRLKKKYEKRKLNVVFHVYDDSKWKSQSLYEEFSKDNHFNVKILVTRSAAIGEKNPSFEPLEDVKKVFEFFKSKNMNVEYAYDLKKEKFIPLKNFKPDIIIYQHPWYVESCQGPVVCSKFAICYYVPYFVATSNSWIEYGLRFHQYVHKHFVLNKEVADFYSSKMENKGSNLVISGHPVLDFYSKSKNNNEKQFVIYAPHHSIEDNNLNWATFLWSGKFMLEWAKAHSDFNWIFKPHPSLKNRLLNFYTKNEIENYWNAWAEIGTVYQSGDYENLFLNSKCLITDCGSFLTEYLLTDRPVIRLKNLKACKFNSNIEKITKCYYNVKNTAELEQELIHILLNNNDEKFNDRQIVKYQLNLNNTSAAKQILDYIKAELTQ